MLEKSVERFFQEIADRELPQSRVSIQQSLQQGRARLRRRRLIRAVGTPAVAAVATLAVVMAGAIPATIGHSRRPQTRTYGKLVGGAFDPSHLVVAYGWLPKGTLVTNAETSPGVETLNAYGPHSDLWVLGVYARSVCDVKKAARQFTCLRAVATNNPMMHSPALPVTGHGPTIDGHKSLWLDGGLYLAWQYAPRAWALLTSLNEATIAVRIARAVEYGRAAPKKYGQRASFTFASRFTSLPRGWRIIGVMSARQDGVYLTMNYQIARIHTISPATPTDTFSADEPDIAVTPAAAANCGGRPGATHRRVTIDGHLFILSDFRTKLHRGVVMSELALCGDHVDGLLVSIFDIGFGAHPHLALSPAQLMERMQLLGNNPANWVTNPLP